MSHPYDSGIASGTLYGIGVGPGDPELLTVRAVRLIESATVVAYHAGRTGRSLARAAAEPYLPAGLIEEELLYPVTTGDTDHPGGYAGAMTDFYAECGERLAGHLAAGRDVMLLTEGDPTLYSSYAHLHRPLSTRFRCVIVPGITSVSAAAAAAGTPMVEADEVLAVLPATLDESELREWCGRADALALLKVSRNLDGIRRGLAAAGRLDQAVVVSRASHGDERVVPLADAAGVPYMSAVLVPGAVASRRPAAREFIASNGSEPSSVGSVTVVGLGPAGPEWRTPEVVAALTAADDLVGYRTYVDRVPTTSGQVRHISDNRVEAERAEFALELARRGRRVAVVSSGDPGVFAMATAVLEVQADRGYDDVPVTILPGVTAANAVASRVGAPLGHDYCVLSLSDQLKPWSVIMDRLDAAAGADLVLALYNTGSRTRNDRIAEVVECLLRHHRPDTPVVVGRAVGSSDERVEIIELAALRAEHVDMRTLLIIGSSATRWPTRGVVFTPRRYAQQEQPV